VNRTISTPYTCYLLLAGCCCQEQQQQRISGAAVGNNKVIFALKSTFLFDAIIVAFIVITK
jgi:hypothetical protein